MPFQTILSILNIIISSLIPAYETIAIANFINTALDIFNGQVGYTSIYLPLGLIALSIIYKNIIPSITNLIDLSGKNKLNTKLKADDITIKSKDMERIIRFAAFNILLNPSKICCVGSVQTLLIRSHVSLFSICLY